MMQKLRSSQGSRPWYLYLFALAAVVIVILGVDQLGTTKSSARTSTETVTAANGVVQSTISGSGSVEPGVQEDVNFGTSGTLKAIYVKVGQTVKKGQLLAELDPTEAKLTLAEAKLALSEAKEALTEAEDGDSSSSSSSSTGSGSSSSSSGTTENTTLENSNVVHAEFVSADTATSTTTTGTTTTGSGTTTTGATKTKTSTTESGTTTTKKRSGSGTHTSTTSSQQSSSSSGSNSSSASSSGDTDTSTTSTTSTVSASTVAADKLQVAEDKATVATDAKAVKNTKLYAPVAGEIASLSSTAVGESVSSGTNSSAASSSSDSSSSSSSSGSTGSSTSSGGSSSSAFLEIVNSKLSTMTVELSEANISSLKVGQVATVDISALTGVELAGKVTAISPLGTTSDDVVEYDATITIYQHNPKVLPGMSATATIVTAQASGVTIPTEALSGSGATATVNLIGSNGKTTQQQVIVALRGSSMAVIASGLKAGQQVKITVSLPSLGSSTSSSSSSTSSSSSRSGFGSSGGFSRSSSGGFSGGGGMPSGGGGAP